MKSVRGLFLGLALVVPAVSFAADLTAEQIIEKVSQTYGGFRSFRFELRQSQPPFNISGILGPQDLPAPFGDRPTRCETDLAVSTPGKIRLVVSTREAKILLVSDGWKTWAYIPDLNEYIEADAAPLLQELWKYPIRLISDDLARYRSLSQEAKRTKLRGEETLSLGGRQVRCYVVEFLTGAVWWRLWVDEQRFIVLRDEAISDTTSGGADPITGVSPDAGYFSTAGAPSSRLAKADLGPISNDVFEFAVPSGARRMDSFSAPAGRVQEAEERLEARLIGSEKDEYLLQSSKARDFTAASLGGGDVRLDSLRGKIVVLDFWASWCEPCQVELAAIQKLHDELASKGVVFLGIDDEGSDTVQGFVKAHGYTFPMLLDSQQTVHGLYGVRLAPTTVVIDRKGKIAAHYVGAGGEAQLRRALKSAGLNTTP